MAEEERPPYQPSLPRRVVTAANIGVVGFICRTFLYGLNSTEAPGLDHFLELLDSREDERRRTRGLITVSNHVSVLDDPMMWGVLPFAYHWNPNSMRWSLGSYDIVFRNRFQAAFFNYGNTLPTHRLAHSPHGGLFQPTMTQCIRLLSDPHSGTALHSSDPLPSPSFPTSDPFSSATLTYTITGSDSFPAPSAYPVNRHSWIHIFPEGMTHQHPDRIMRYFKWGVARLILESEPCPDVLPIWIDGPQQVMNYERTWPRFVPRAGKDVSVRFGEVVDSEVVWGPLRERWRGLKERARRRRVLESGGEAGCSATEVLGELQDDELKYGAEAQQLRIDVTLAVRNEVLKVRRASGLPDEDPKRALAETYREEGGKEAGRVEGSNADGSATKPGL
ncbi:Lyso-phosphatidylcholine acyltransferase [Friedmanniomyces endolithicus]|uniref:Tafazzin family protein n=1 Tax=Friedmanniomyces endolithicus TaxID=329885 RepID=A0AAN6KVM3_9PEZI|nr:Lyso-phosphatidylcholine acyltransferase [Friedmanniomyces endolithicus]KAK0784192.1 Lyso-phosphatidylcholine acyltransferase [Friedmanniomyces endolithicus]KAK0798561.1 Lyso-phosphatidylcholine acyltransferase [Friedmanniomyces endolithicus]KAK0807721.1 Lyso-phosphatidylcholine acyltransferase [Friedmanniomyces endolithicus]KAK0843527.1 Lyso-phosphatidylcholine acyltransferase [Friedmanniomyces endolithicus]